MRILWWVPALLIGIGIAAPLLVLQAGQTAHVDRIGGLGGNLDGAGAHMLLPVGRFVADPEDPAAVYKSNRAELYYGGTVFTVAAWAGIAALFGLLIGCRLQPARLLIGRNVWLICAAVALLLGLGAAGLLWDFMAKLPMFAKFNVPKKFLAYTNLFSILGGGLVLERLLAGTRRRIDVWIAAAACAFLMFHLYMSDDSFCTFGAPPYPPVSAEIRTRVIDPNAGRFHVIAPVRSKKPSFARSMALNFATVAGGYAFLGYDPLVECTPSNVFADGKLNDDPVGAARAYGVHWLLVSPLTYVEPTWSPDWVLKQINPRGLRSVALFRDGADSVLNTPDGVLYHLREASPMAFRAAAPEQPLPVAFDSTGVRVDVSSIPAGEKVVVNILWRPWLTAQDIALRADAWKRVELTLPRTMKTLRIQFSPPWQGAAAAGIVTLLLGILSGFAVPVAQRRLATAMTRISERLPLGRIADLRRPVSPFPSIDR